MLLMVQKGIIGGMSLYLLICKSMKDFDKDKKLSYLQYWDVINLYPWAMSQNPPVNNFEWITLMRIS